MARFARVGRYAPLAQRFWKLVNKDGPIMPGMDTPCWIWTAGKTRGYGQIRGDEGKTVYAHRAAWFLEHGEWPPRLLCHHCDNPPCVRPDHLFCGTHADNWHDAMAKGRNPHGVSHSGENAPHRILDWKRVREIRHTLKQGHYQREVADRFGVSRSTVAAIYHGRIWREAS
jgi:DNA-binding XRE family transcriptional regulator